MGGPAAVARPCPTLHVLGRLGLFSNFQFAGAADHGHAAGADAGGSSVPDSGRPGPSGSGAATSGPTSAESAERPLSGVAELRTILRIRAFRRLWLVLGLSALGDWLGLLATSTFAAEQVSGSLAKGAAFGSVIAVRLLPALVLGPVAGVLADRFDRRYTMAVCDLIRFTFFDCSDCTALAIAR